MSPDYTRTPAPCRLTVYLARQAPLGVVLRRGPSNWVRLSLWHTDDDQIEHGQWLGGRIYERRSDVSADGRLFAAFVRKSGRPRAEQKADTWVAISRPPWFTALALWWVGGTYCMGGFFPARDTVWLGFGTPPPDIGTLPRHLRLSGERPPYVDRTNNWTDRTVYHNRMLRDGWTPLPPAAKDTPDAGAERWQHRHPNRPLILTMTETQVRYPAMAYGGPYVVRYAVHAASEGTTEEPALPGPEVLALGQATWADWDQHGRLAIAREGRLLYWRPEDPTGQLHEIADFNGQTPDPQPAPDWARSWPAG